MPRCLRSGSMVLLPVMPVTDVDKAAGHGCRRCRCGTYKMRPPIPALAAFEIAVAGRGTTLLGRENVGVHAQAHRTARLAPLCTGLFEDAIETLAFGRPLDRLGPRHDKHAHIRMDTISSNDLGGR